MGQLPLIPDYLVQLAEIIERCPGAETLLLVRVNKALEEVRALAVQHHGLLGGLLPDLISLGERYRLAGPDRPDPAPKPAARQPATPGRLLQFPGGAGI